MNRKTGYAMFRHPGKPASGGCPGTSPLDPKRAAEHLARFVAARWAACFEVRYG